MAETTIGSSIVIDGEISGEESLVIQGTVKGKISVTEGVYIENSATVNADINAQTVENAGVLTGNVNAQNRVELKSESKMIGDVCAPRIQIADGALFKGNIDMDVER